MNRAERVPWASFVVDSRPFRWHVRAVPLSVSHAPSPVLFHFDVRGAQAAASANEIDAWVDAFLTSGGPGTNLPMARGLKLQRRWWIGPLRVPLASLTRICGPEPGMPYRTTSAAWEAHVSAIAASVADPEMLPPLILEYRKGLLALCDGNHRHEALRRLGETDVWVLIWCNSRQAYQAARVRLIDGRPRT